MSLNKAVCIQDSLDNKLTKWSTRRTLLCAQSQLKNIRLGSKCQKVISHKLCIKKVVTDDLADILHFLQNWGNF